MSADGEHVVEILVAPGGFRPRCSVCGLISVEMLLEADAEAVDGPA